MAVIKLVPRNSSIPSGYTVVDQHNMYSDTDSDQYCYISSPSSSNGTIWLYDFNTEDIPFSSIKEVNSITVKIKARNTGVTCNIVKNGTSTPSYGHVMVPNTVSVYTFDDVTLTVYDIEDLGPYLAIKVPVYASSYSTVRIYGAEILIDYTPLYNKVEYGDKTLIDLTADTVTPSSLLQGYTAHDNTGALITGTATGGGTGAVSVIDTKDTNGGTIRTITAVDISDTTAVASDVAQGKYFYTADGTKTEGTSTGDGGETWNQVFTGDVVTSGEAAPFSGTINAVLSGADTIKVFYNDTEYILPKQVTDDGIFYGATPGATPSEIDFSEIPFLIRLGEVNTALYTQAPGPQDVTILEPQSSGTPSGIKYLYEDVDGEGAWTGLDQYEYISYNYAPVKDNKFRFWIKLDSSDLTFKAPATVPTYASYRYTGSIDWGDGSPITDFAYGDVDHTHTYTEAGTYCVEIWWTGGSERLSVDNPQTADRGKVIAIEFYMLDYPTNYISVALPNLTKVRYSSLQTSVGWTNCTKLEDIILPDSTLTVTGILNSHALRKLTIPASVTTISGSFSGNTTMEEYHFLPVNPPTVTTSNLFRDIPANCKIYVPSDSLTAYQTATNWSTYASYMVGE